MLSQYYLVPSWKTDNKTFVKLFKVMNTEHVNITMIAK